jgi:hypothetical protein
MMNGHREAILDASILYGACRWHTGHYKDPSRRWPGNYSAADDEEAFLEFLHMLLLYDTLSVQPNGTFLKNEVQEFKDQIDSVGSEPQLVGGGYNISDDNKRAVATYICRQLLKLREDYGQFSDWKVPFLYQGHEHVDFQVFREAASDYGLPEKLIPFALFAYRGYCYMGAATARSTPDVPVIYVASSGRLQVLAKLLSQKAMDRYEFQKIGYGEVFDELHLPRTGLIFSEDEREMPYELSQLQLHIAGYTPQKALDYVLRLRDSDDIKRLRSRWADILRSAGSGKPTAVGAPYGHTRDPHEDQSEWRHTVASQVPIDSIHSGR